MTMNPKIAELVEAAKQQLNELFNVVSLLPDPLSVTICAKISDFITTSNLVHTTICNEMLAGISDLSVLLEANKFEIFCLQKELNEYKNND